MTNDERCDADGLQGHNSGRVPKRLHDVTPWHQNCVTAVSKLATVL
ncbi:MAG: hypothetical protein JWQ50_3939 [Caballeronia mineralivorans]|jgi:hypothetical protein|nr:hypothetical protein [Caballeronia mineralivorans]